MNIYLETLYNDINKALEQSHVCRGEWCRALESDIDALHYELMAVNQNKGVLERIRFEEMSDKIRNAYRHLTPDIHI